MDNAFNIVKKDFFLKSKNTINEGNQFSLLFQNEKVEIIKYHYPAKTEGTFDAIREEGVIEAYYVISGMVKFVEENGTEHLAEEGDLFYISYKNPYITFEVLEDTIWLSFINHLSYEEDAKNTDSIISIMKVLQEKDGDTFNHCDRVKKLVTQIGQRIGYPNEDITLLMNAAMFHDVGKYKIPLEILLKPARLDENEFEIMKKHSLFSDEVVRSLLGDRIGQIVRAHHEKLDGSGYPDGLKADKIPIESKMIAVADAYDAMVTVRPYNKGKTTQEAIAELKRCAGTQFDAECVDALCNYLEFKNEK